MKKSALTDQALLESVHEISMGLVDADLGGHVVKKRVRLPGQGKRSGARTIVATKLADRYCFIFGFAKNERANIGKNELKALQELAKDLLTLDDKEMQLALAAGEVMEVTHDNHKLP